MEEILSPLRSEAGDEDHGSDPGVAHLHAEHGPPARQDAARGRQVRRPSYALPGPRYASNSRYMSVVEVKLK